ncbi:MAG: hypothetical protein HYZ89_04730, partial [Candidatus Omnitrophica bacterium]|nr:hypothetical protein [Candidatus Omnitrophota bacterium]
FRHREDARWHLTHAVQRHEALFGQRPCGMWPPEGSVSEELVRLAIEAQVRWIATDEEILWRTLRTARSPSWLYRPHRLDREQGSLHIVFRDRELSDLIGFVYSQWNASMAIQDFLQRLHGIAQRVQAKTHPALVSIILDGENAWECYPHDGHDFLQGLYHALANDDQFRLVTVTEFLNRFPFDESPSLPDVFPGSWIDGNFSTWVGHPEKNTAWTHLARVRQDLEAVTPPSPEAWRHFYIAEGSDWMWWFGDTHSSAQDEEFDRLFRLHLANVYRELKQDVPAWLQVPITTTSLPSGSEPSAAIHPMIDGLETSYFEWLYAGWIDLRKGSGAMHRSTQYLQTFYYGCDLTHDYFRLDIDPTKLAALTSWRIQLEIPDHDAQLTVHGAPGQEGVIAFLSILSMAPPQTGGGSNKPMGQTGLSKSSYGRLSCAYRHILELAVPKALLSRHSGDVYHVRLSLYEGTELIECYPPHGTFRMPIPSADFESANWSV